jgi:hypothetical protein
MCKTEKEVENKSFKQNHKENPEIPLQSKIYIYMPYRSPKNNSAK